MKITFSALVRAADDRCNGSRERSVRVAVATVGPPLGLMVLHLVVLCFVARYWLPV
ncbi:hypothetical protein ACTJLC_18495 [Paraburkholderia sp. 22099]|uniref:hypothetical protein n=1 Tax=Paraburkholderia sp. 22099 TaxID=3453875 RepID=UPI003F82F4A0